ncbi:MAG TPA: gephyrin-like molybdotransferase Glp [Candidatus Dormibacteraeota bacterium]
METVAGAQRRILARLAALPAERVEIADAVGRVLAEPVVSTRTLPPFDNSAMDGYALRAADVAGAAPGTPLVLPVVGESLPGRLPGPLAAGTAMRIMTGAPLPRGADAVVPHEHTDNGRERVAVRVHVNSGDNKRGAGSDIRPGDIVLPRGRRLRGPDLAVCAALGQAAVAVSRRPRVAVLSTGDELVEVGTEPAPGQIVDSNAAALAAAVVEAGGRPVRVGIARDTAADLRDKFHAATAAGCDLLVSSAGVSVGDHDHVRDVVGELGDLDFWRVAMRPGKPLAVGHVAGVPFVGLPGNPVSSLVTFELFVRPAILALQGATELHRRRSAARALEPLPKPAGLETFLRGVLVAARAPGELPGVRLTGGQDSGRIRSMAEADCLIVLPAEGTRVESGAAVEVIPLP